MLSMQTDSKYISIYSLKSCVYLNMKYMHIKDANEDEFKMFSIQTYSKGILHIKVLHFETRLMLI